MAVRITGEFLTEENGSQKAMRRQSYDVERKNPVSPSPPKPTAVSRSVCSLLRARGRLGVAASGRHHLVAPLPCRPLQTPVCRVRTPVHSLGGSLRVTVTPTIFRNPAPNFSEPRQRDVDSTSHAGRSRELNGSAHISCPARGGHLVGVSSLPHSTWPTPPHSSGPGSSVTSWQSCLVSPGRHPGVLHRVTAA